MLAHSIQQASGFPFRKLSLHFCTTRKQVTFGLKNALYPCHLRTMSYSAFQHLPRLSIPQMFVAAEVWWSHKKGLNWLLYTTLFWWATEWDQYWPPFVKYVCFLWGTRKKQWDSEEFLAWKSFMRFAVTLNGVHSLWYSLLSTHVWRMSLFSDVFKDFSLKITAVSVEHVWSKYGPKMSPLMKKVANSATTMS